MNNLTAIEYQILNLFETNFSWYHKDLISFFRKYNSSNEYLNMIEFNIYELYRKQYIFIFYDYKYERFFTKNSNIFNPIPLLYQQKLNQNRQIEFKNLQIENVIISNRQLREWEQNKEKDEIQKQKSLNLQEKSIRRSSWNNFWVIMTFLFGIFAFYKNFEIDDLKSKIVALKAIIQKRN